MSLLDHDVLVIDQVTSFLRNDFQIFDAQGQPVGQILTQGSGLSRAIMGTRQLIVAEPDGTQVMVVDDVPSFGRDTFDLLGLDGNRFAEVIKQFTLFNKHLTVQTGGRDRLGPDSTQGAEQRLGRLEQFLNRHRRNGAAPLFGVRPRCLPSTGSGIVAEPRGSCLVDLGTQQPIRRWAR
ncbi:hypothetical protein [Luteococcus japonicus]|uniref:Uncharacterized protein n=1 Tax=Luteococcus japonicus LSP_Lj1 TaxID=1255658 RepID=A0A1R4K765_9ACTN|nr:hypothetical protein [Luteococcus japonicus]SJN40147.1 hypothetical protein FM114_11965 [Luteococcus japonicus LSP_Lj1]